MAGDNYTLYQAIFLIEICFKDLYKVSGLFNRNKTFWSLEIKQNAIY